MATNVSSVARLMRAVAVSRALGGFRHALPSNSLQKRFVSTNEAPKNELQVTFVKCTGERVSVNYKVGQTLLDIVVDNELDFPGYGACEGTLTCSTCHVILSQEDFDRMPRKPEDEENDMLDLASELCDTSRLGCQIIMTEELNGLEVRLPKVVSDARK